MTLKFSCESLDPSPKFNYALSILYQVHEKVGLAKGWKSLTGNCWTVTCQEENWLLIITLLTHKERGWGAMEKKGKNQKMNGPREKSGVQEQEHTNDSSRNILAQLIKCKIHFTEGFFSSVIIFCSSPWCHHRQLLFSLPLPWLNLQLCFPSPCSVKVKELFSSFLSHWKSACCHFHSGLHLLSLHHRRNQQLQPQFFCPPFHSRCEL